MGARRARTDACARGAGHASGTLRPLRGGQLALTVRSPRSHGVFPSRSETSSRLDRRQPCRVSSRLRLPTPPTMHAVTATPRSKGGGEVGRVFGARCTNIPRGMPRHREDRARRGPASVLPSACHEIARGVYCRGTFAIAWLYSRRDVSFAGKGRAQGVPIIGRTPGRSAPRVARPRPASSRFRHRSVSMWGYCECRTGPPARTAARCRPSPRASGPHAPRRAS